MDPKQGRGGVDPKQGRGGWGETGKIRGKENYTQHILFEKRFYFQ